MYGWVNTQRWKLRAHNVKLESRKVLLGTWYWLPEETIRTPNPRGVNAPPFTRICLDTPEDTLLLCSAIYASCDPRLSSDWLVCLPLFLGDVRSLVLIVVSRASRLSLPPLNRFGNTSASVKLRMAIWSRWGCRSGRPAGCVGGKRQPKRRHVGITA